MDMKLEVVVIPVSDVDRAKAFYEKLGFRLDIDYAPDENFRVIQSTPPRSEASIIFGKGITSAKPGSPDSLVLAVDDVDAARDELIACGVNVSEVFHYAGGPFNNAMENPLVCFVRGSRREQLAAPGDHDAPCRPRMGAEASANHGRRDPCRTSPRNVGAPRPLRENARRTSLVGLVRAISECASEWQQSGGGSRRRRPLHGRGLSCSSSMIVFCAI